MFVSIVFTPFIFNALFFGIMSVSRSVTNKKSVLQTLMTQFQLNACEISNFLMRFCFEKPFKTKCNLYANVTLIIKLNSVEKTKQQQDAAANLRIRFHFQNGIQNRLVNVPVYIS